jgi:transposase
MRGQERNQGEFFSYISLEARVPSGHPLRKVRELVRGVLIDMDGDFDDLYSRAGRPSIPPEQLLSALLLQVFYGVRSERQLMEQLNYNLLFRWFVGLTPDAPVWNPTVFTKNRDRLQEGAVFKRFMTVLLEQPQVKPLLSDEHFSVDGTLIEAWASQKSFTPKDGDDDQGDGSNWHKEKRSNETHASKTDPDCRLYRRGGRQEAKLCYMGHALMENRHGLAVGGMVTEATGKAEREASEAMLAEKVKATGKPATVGEDKAYDVREHAENLRKLGVTLHAARHNAPTKTGKTRTSTVDDVMAASDAYGMSQTRRKMIECIFGWGKQHGTMRKTKHRGVARVAGDFFLNLIAYNLVRIPKFLAT